MPTLPTFTVTQTTADRLLAAFSGQTAEDGTALTPAMAYKRWLRERLTAHVANIEGATTQTTLKNDMPLT